MPGWISSKSRERRGAERRIPEQGEPLARVRLRTGRELDVIDLSNVGALVEGAARLLPGTRVDVHVVTRDGRVLVRCRIIRAHVCQLQADQVRYRGALAFEETVDTARTGYAVPAVLLDAAAPAGNGYPDDPGSALAEPAESDSSA